MKKILALVIAFLIILAACGNQSNHEHHSHEGKLKVVTTNSILYDMVKRVGGNKVDVHSIVPVGQDPHEYEVKPKDIKALTDADVVFYNGLNITNDLVNISSNSFSLKSDYTGVIVPEDTLLALYTVNNG